MTEPKTLIEAVRHFSDLDVCNSYPEEWRAIAGQPDYEVSSHGRVRSLPRRVMHGHGWQDLPMRIRTLSPDAAGYQIIIIKRHRYYVHRLVLEAFVGPCPEGHESRHFPDRNPANNRLDNLSWASHEQNIADRRTHGTAPLGTKQTNSKLTDDDVRAIKRRLASGEGQNSIARDYPVSRALIQAIKAGKTWNHVTI
jgi:hypothetical protein